jgi:hypothetical protein
MIFPVVVELEGVPIAVDNKSQPPGKNKFSSA